MVAPKFIQKTFGAITFNYLFLGLKTSVFEEFSLNSHDVIGFDNGCRG